ncbi:MAG: PDZ domain-containing protein, partial [Rhodanobacteraceae bacterium]
LRDLKTGQKVAIDYLRDGKKGSVTFAAERREARNWSFVMDDDPEHPMLPKDFNDRVRADVERATREAERQYERDHKRYEQQAERATRDAMKHVPKQMRVSMPWWGLNLAALNADLGRYFGADKGVLVLATDEDSMPGIRAGDVITSVAGEPVNRPEDALRALRDQESGKDVPIKVLRDRKTLALNMKAPAFNSIFNLRIAPPAPPAPASAPVPVAVPAPAAVPAPPAPPAPEPVASR